MGVYIDGGRNSTEFKKGFSAGRELQKLEQKIRDLHKEVSESTDPAGTRMAIKDVLNETYGTYVELARIFEIDTAEMASVKSAYEWALGHK
jgi:hypothetical protein